ncbi:hypothetical protein, partial [Shinella granuli]|uniref:hypothetical protein n=1 Tax=Shinella granuli TaxID=323621 RepID=UPI0010564510
RHHLGTRGRLFLGMEGRDHFGIRGRFASEFAPTVSPINDDIAYDSNLIAIWIDIQMLSDR